MLRDQTLNFLKGHNLTIDTSLDEQQLIDPNVIESLIEYAKVGKKDTVLEIGPGIGNITIQLAEASGYLYAIEKNQKFIAPLIERCESYSNISLVHADALREPYPVFNKLVSNLPYRICESVLNRLKYEKFDAASLVVSSSFANILTAQKNDSTYSKLSLVTKLFFDITLVENITPDSYHPPPRVDTCIITLCPRKKLTKTGQILQDLIRQSDKKTRNALREAFIRTGVTSTKKNSLVFISGLDLDDSIFQRRVALLSLKDLMEIQKNIENRLEIHG